MHRLSTTTTIATGSMTTTLVGDASAVGEDTLTQIKETSSIVQTGRAVKAMGVIIATAEAEGDSTYASALTDVDVSGADRVKICTKTVSVHNDDGSSFEMSITRFTAIDLPKVHGPTKYIVHESHIELDHFDFDIDGNTATVDFNAIALGNDTLVDADVYALTVEDALSLSTLVVTSAVG